MTRCCDYCKQVKMPLYKVEQLKQVICKDCFSKVNVKWLKHDLQGYLEFPLLKESEY